jgi:LytS/YehU family sensor histidine kinase
MKWRAMLLDGYYLPSELHLNAENAILHGLNTQKRDRLLEICIFKRQNKFKLAIEDNGIDHKAAGRPEAKGNNQCILLSSNRLAILTEKMGIHYDL